MAFLQDMTNDELQEAHNTAHNYASTVVKVARSIGYRAYFAIAAIVSIECEISARNLKVQFKIYGANVWN